MDAHFNWYRCGRQYVARVGSGKLSITVRMKGSERRGDDLYGVGDVLGNPFLDNGGWTNLETAKARAEELAINEMVSLSSWLERYLKQQIDG